MSKLVNKIIVWIIFFLICYAIYSTFSGEGYSRCQYVEEIDDYVCDDPRY